MRATLLFGFPLTLLLTSILVRAPPPNVISNPLQVYQEFAKDVYPRELFTSDEEYNQQLKTAVATLKYLFKGNEWKQRTSHCKSSNSSLGLLRWSGH